MVDLVGGGSVMNGATPSSFCKMNGRNTGSIKTFGQIRNNEQCNQGLVQKGELVFLYFLFFKLVD